LVVLEDLHWSDDTSLEFLLHLARRVPRHPVLLLLTYRTDEPHPGLEHFLAELERERLATELPLPRLTEADLDAMLRAILGPERRPRAAFRAAMYALTDGNPFFVEEILKSLAFAGDLSRAEDAWGREPLGDLRIPRTIRDAVL